MIKKCSNPTSAISDEIIANPNAQIVGDDLVRLQVPREVPSFDELEPQTLLNSPSLDVSLGDVISPELPIKPHSPNSSRMKVVDKEVDSLTINTPPSPYVASSHPKDTKSASLGVDISNWEMFDDDWGLESKEVSRIGKELSLLDRPNKVERGRILEAHRLEPILQQQISQRIAPSHHDGFMQPFIQELTYGIKYRKFFIKNKNFVFTDCGDGVTINTRRRHHDTCDGVTPTLTTSNAQVIFDEKKLGSS
ncbi:hypothetical protein Tco_1399475 [Tanacetum coccineum]